MGWCSAVRVLASGEATFAVVRDVCRLAGTSTNFDYELKQTSSSASLAAWRCLWVPGSWKKKGKQKKKFQILGEDAFAVQYRSVYFDSASPELRVSGFGRASRTLGSSFDRPARQPRPYVIGAALNCSYPASACSEVEKTMWTIVCLKQPEAGAR